MLAWMAVLAGAALKGSVVFIAAVFANRGLRRAPAALRHAIWLAALLVHLGLPLLGAALPSWRVIPWRVGPRAFSAVPASPPVQRGNVISDAQPPTTHVLGSTGEHGTLSLLFMFWALGAAVVLVRIARGIGGAAQLRRRARAVGDSDTIALMQGLADDLAVTRPVGLLETASLRTPVAIGIVRPAIILPLAARSWPSHRLRAVLLHEFAHVRRRDVLTHLCAQLTTAVFWFDPFVWIAVSKLRVERERACDDAVLRGGIRASVYVLDLVRLSQRSRVLGEDASGLALARVPDLERRMLALLDSTVDRTTVPRSTTFAVAATAMLVAAPLGMSAPYLPSQRTPALASPEAAPAPGDSASRPPLPRVARARPAPAREAHPPAVVATAPVEATRPRVDSGFACPFRGGTHMNWTESSPSGVVLWRVRWSGTNCDVDWRSEGDVRFTDDGSDIASISHGGSVTLRATDASGQWQLHVVPSGDGPPAPEWFRDGAPAPTAAGRLWLAGFLREVDKQGPLPR